MRKGQKESTEDAPRLCPICKQEYDVKVPFAFIFRGNFYDGQIFQHVSGTVDDGSFCFMPWTGASVNLKDFSDYMELNEFPRDDK